MMQEDEGRTITIEPTYRMGPEKDEKVKYEVVRQIAEETLEEVLGKGDYDASTAPKVSKNIAERIIQQLSKPELKYTRYKFACQVTLGEVKDQGVRISSRCLWDPQYDICVSAKYQKKDIYASAVIFCIYFL